MPLSIDSDMEYGDDKESREDDNTVVSFTATVGFALAVGPIDDDDNAGDDVVVGAGSVVTKSISKPGIYAGNPARFLRSSK